LNNLRDKKVLIAFGNHVRKLRKARNLSMEALSYEVDVDLSQIFRIEKGKINPTLTTLAALSNALNITLAELLTFEF
jgi:transcriptional regulator with XRE-family HTH domain